MKNIFPVLFLFLHQIYLTLVSVTTFGKYLNPVLLFFVSAAIPAYLVWIHLQNPSATSAEKKNSKVWVRITWVLGGLISILIAYEEFRKLLVEYSEPEKWSDVIPQVKTLYNRFSEGVFPYEPIPLIDYVLQPVYMPLHWLPMGLAVPFNIDIRWVGFGIFALVAAFYGWFLANRTDSAFAKIITLVLPSLPLWGFVNWGRMDISVTYEIVIGAYYLLLAIGLFTKRLWIVIPGIILCLLSRYTLVFWLPLFAILLYYEQGLKKSIIAWGAVACCIIILFILPFYVKDPALIKKGLEYYTQATVLDWHGYGEPPISYTQEKGISFAPLMRASFGGELAERIYVARVIQSIALLLTLIGGLWAYRQWKKKIDMFTYCLIALYVFMMVYYFFAPLTYRYYLFPFLVVSAVLCGKIICHDHEKNITSHIH